MQDHLFKHSNSGKYIAGLIAVLVLAAGAFFAYQGIMHWHRQSVQKAVEETEVALKGKSDGMEAAAEQLERQMAERSRRQQKASGQSRAEAGTAQKASAEHIRNVFGEASQDRDARTMGSMEAPSCFRLEKQIHSFFNYLDREGFVDAAGIEAEGARRVFEQTIAELAQNPPLVVGETQDIVSLMHNQAHFFRVMDKKRITLAKYLFNLDADVLEHAMHNFYLYYVEKSGCGAKAGPAVSLESLYEYASFFLNTFSGRSYLMRRPSTIRCLVRYYSVLVLDKANKATLNRHGIDIRPHIRLALDAIRNQKNLMYRQGYVEKLRALEEKYG